MSQFLRTITEDTCKVAAKAIRKDYPEYPYMEILKVVRRQLLGETFTPEQIEERIRNITDELYETEE